MKKMMKQNDQGVYPRNKQKISIQLSFNDIVLLCICLYSFDVVCMIECLH